MSPQRDKIKSEVKLLPYGTVTLEGGAVVQWFTAWH